MIWYLQGPFIWQHCFTRKTQRNLCAKSKLLWSLISNNSQKINRYYFPCSRRCNIDVIHGSLRILIKFFLECNVLEQSGKYLDPIKHVILKPNATDTLQLSGGHQFEPWNPPRVRSHIYIKLEIAVLQLELGESKEQRRYPFGSSADMLIKDEILGTDKFTNYLPNRRTCSPSDFSLVKGNTHQRQH